MFSNYENRVTCYNAITDFFRKTPHAGRLMNDLLKIYEVGPRDGLQNEAVTLSAAQKQRLIDGLVEAGLRHIRRPVSFTLWPFPSWPTPTR